jgi:hypothetical protein
VGDPLERALLRIRAPTTLKSTVVTRSSEGDAPVGLNSDRLPASLYVFHRLNSGDFLDRKLAQHVVQDAAEVAERARLRDALKRIARVCEGRRLGRRRVFRR